ncbi:hypothetical protein [Flavobacterium sp. PL02]|jgi:hypothetical protein|uniref:hypothetical protein n=1 Tax=Flavobacterium sp. PL02 TaxID=3088354 RepID=UPI002B223242|nr:hypothetical protein [Flavobacterium sp. PL02]MEA9414399.1 hypothetical protein [Flavobacterium sp. PL02]
MQVPINSYKINKTLELNKINKGESTDNVLVHGVDNEVKSVPRSEFGGGPQALDETLGNGNVSNKTIELQQLGESGFVVRSTSLSPQEVTVLTPSTGETASLRQKGVTVVNANTGKSVLVESDSFSFSNFGQDIKNKIVSEQFSEDFTHTLQAKNGIIAHIGDIPTSNTLIHTTGNEVKTGTLRLITPDVMPGIANLNAQTPLLVRGGNGGDNTNTTGTVVAGNAANIYIQSGGGGAAVGVVGTGISGTGGNITVVAGDGGVTSGSGTLFPGSGGNIIVKAGNTQGGIAGTTEFSAGNNDKLGALGGNIHLIAGWGNDSTADNSLYNGTIFLGVSTTNVVRGNVVIGNSIDNRIDRLQVEGTVSVKGTVSGSAAKLDNQFVTKVQLDEAVVPYKTYVAQITQITEAPPIVINVLEDSLGQAVTFEYGSIGNFYVKMEGGFPESKTYCMIMLSGAGFGGTVYAQRIATKDIQIITRGSNFMPTDGLLRGATIEIRVYS